MRRFECRQDAFEPRQRLERVERLRISHITRLGASERTQPRVLRSDRRVVEARRNRMRQLDVPSSSWSTNVRRLAARRAAAGEPRGMPAADDLFAAGLDADQADRLVVDERVEHPDRVAAAADAGDDRIRQTAGELGSARASRPMTDWNSRTISG